MAGGVPAKVTVPVIVPAVAGSSGVAVRDAVHALSSRPQAARRPSARARNARDMGATIGRAPHPVKFVLDAALGRGALPRGWCARYRGARTARARMAAPNIGGAEHN